MNYERDTDELIVQPIDETEEPSDRSHEEQHAHYSHELSDDDKEASGRAIVRTVPLLYGFLAGALFHDLAAGLAVGGAVMLGTDLAMGQRSLFRPLLQRPATVACPVIAVLAHGLAAVIAAIGLTAPSALRGMRCGVSE
ncbi:MAG: hypothetical protein LJE59_13115 [Chromatiaceae bacterium]|nr:hypothetical protein [Chromatiaceae bacterium]